MERGGTGDRRRGKRHNRGRERKRGTTEHQVPFVAVRFTMTGDEQHLRKLSLRDRVRTVVFATSTALMR